MTQVFSDSTQLAAIRQAQQSVAKDMRLSEGQRDYWNNVLESIGDRIEDAALRKKKIDAQKRGERQG